MRMLRIRNRLEPSDLLLELGKAIELLGLQHKALKEPIQVFDGTAPIRLP